MFENYVVDDYLLNALDNDTFVPAPLPKVHLTGASIDSIVIGDGSSRVVVFSPTRATRRAVEALTANTSIDLSIEDANGLFTHQIPQAFVDFIYSPGNDTIVITTEDQE